MIEIVDDVELIYEIGQNLLEEILLFDQEGDIIGVRVPGPFRFRGKFMPRAKFYDISYFFDWIFIKGLLEIDGEYFIKVYDYLKQIGEKRKEVKITASNIYIHMTRHAEKITFLLEILNGIRNRCFIVNWQKYINKCWWPQFHKEYGDFDFLKLVKRRKIWPGNGQSARVIEAKMN